MCIVYADMTLIRSKVKVTQRWLSAPFRGYFFQTTRHLSYSMPCCRIT